MTTVLKSLSHNCCFPEKTISKFLLASVLRFIGQSASVTAKKLMSEVVGVLEMLDLGSSLGCHFQCFDRDEYKVPRHYLGGQCSHRHHR